VKTKQTRWAASIKYIHKSHMSAIVYTSTSHRSIHFNFKVLQNSYHFTIFQRIQVFKIKPIKSSWISSKTFLQFITTLDNLSPTLFSWEIEFSKNLTFLTFFKSTRYDSPNHVQINSIDVCRGLESLITFNYIKRISLEWSRSTPKPQNDKKYEC